VTAEETAMCLARIEQKLDTLIEHKVDHEARIRFLEKDQWIYRGGIAVVSFIAAKASLARLRWALCSMILFCWRSLLAFSHSTKFGWL
jgi:hypothetical protein